MNLLTGKISYNSEGQRGRPVLHPFPGRITFTRDEVETFLENGSFFVEVMKKSHAISKKRRMQMIADGIIPEVEEMNFTFQGPIKTVLKEMQRVITQYSKKGSIRCDFHKVRTYTKESHKNYLRPEVKKEKKNRITTFLECRPDVIYGYVKVIYDK